MSIAVDLDGTLAFYDRWRGSEHVGEPIPKMLARVHRWLALGEQVVIFTARASEPEKIAPVYAWMLKHGLQDCKLSCMKTMDISEFWDDRAVRVEPNTGNVDVAQFECPDGKVLIVPSR